MRALVVEDDPVVASELVRGMTAAGFVVDLAGDGQQAWFNGDVEDYDVAIVDLGLPRLDGLSVVRRWREAGEAHEALLGEVWRAGGPLDEGARGDCIRAAIAYDLAAERLGLERLKAKLLAEGLIDPTRNKRLPEFPRKIGVVTSRTSAAVRDIITTLSRRMPLLQVVLRPALVQGAGSAEDIALAIKQLNEFDDIDMLIDGRGGGSIEDLWAFNEEVVARAIAASRIPIISAVGHEIDFTIADFVADLRAATPTAAAEIAVRDRDELLPMLADLEAAMGSYLHDKLDRGRRDLQALLRSRGLARPLDLVRNHQQRVDDLTHRAALSLRGASTREYEHLRLLEAKLHALSPLSVLSRGFAIIERDGEPVTRAEMLDPGDRVRIRMHDGERRAAIEEDAPDTSTPER